MKGNVMQGVFHYFSDEEARTVHEESLTFLSEKGLVITDDAARRYLMNWGCTCRDGRLFFPVDRIQETLAAYPLKISQDGRPRHTNRGFFTHLDNLREDGITTMSLTDCRHFIQLANGLDAMDCTLLPLSDDSHLQEAIYRLAERESRKPTIYPVFSLEDAHFLKAHPHPESLHVLLGDQLLSVDSVITQQLEILLPTQCPIAITYPLPLDFAGLHDDYFILMGNIHFLVLLILARSIQPDARIYYSGFLKNNRRSLGFRTTEDLNCLYFHTAQSQMAHFYHYPAILWPDDLSVLNDGDPDSIEKCITYYSLIEMCGADLLAWMGKGIHWQSSSFEQLVLDHEIVKAVKPYSYVYSTKHLPAVLETIREDEPQNSYIFNDPKDTDSVDCLSAQMPAPQSWLYSSQLKVAIDEILHGYFKH